jgi:hypothetical protein
MTGLKKDSLGVISHRDAMLESCFNCILLPTIKLTLKGQNVGLEKVSINFLFHLIGL